MTKPKRLLRITGDFDGGNPKLAANITGSGAVFTIRPTWEGAPGEFYGRGFAVTIENPSVDPVTLTLHVDWTHAEHMRFKDAYYLNEEGDEDWNEVRAEVKGTVATVRLKAPAGVSYLALYPMYDYAECLAFVDALRERPEARVKMLGKSRHRREIWGIHVPGKAVAGAEPVAVIARTHACETAGSYMIEGMLRFLLSGEPEATELLRHFSFHFLPMANPDGVFDGLERDTSVHGGAHLDRISAAGDPCHDAIREMLDAVKPGLFVNLHDWVKPDVDGIFCYDELYGQRLVELLPTPDTNPHRMYCEWYSAKVEEPQVVGDAIVYPEWQLTDLRHGQCGTWKDYCREKFGARVMTVQFPWRGRSVDDMRDLGTALLEAVCLIRFGERGMK